MEIKKIIETVFLPEWGSPAYICEGGNIYIELTAGRWYNKQEFLNNELWKTFNELFTRPRLETFEELEKYYKDKYESK